MKFAIVIAIVSQEKENEAIDIAKEHGAGGVTITQGVGVGLNEKKTFFGLTYERSESLLFFVLEKSVSLKVMKALNKGLDMENTGHGMVMSMPISHLAGIPQKQLEKFEDQIREEV